METIKQRTGSDCVLASIAMLAGLDYDHLWSKEDIDRCVIEGGLGNDEIDALLDRVGIKSRRYVYVYDNMDQSLVKKFLFGRRALLGVPSLNHENGCHMVYWDGHKLHDPSMQQTYSWIDQVVLLDVIVVDEVTK